MTTTTILQIPEIISILNDNNQFIDENEESAIPRAKKRRLDHLSWEEKVQRKKLKNRVAAQTSRDRKKAKTEQMEQALQQLFRKNEILITECAELKLANQALLTKNAELQQRLEEEKKNASCLLCQNRTGVCESEDKSTEFFLLPKGSDIHTAAVLQHQQKNQKKKKIIMLLSAEEKKKILLKMMLQVYLLYQIYSKNWNQNTMLISTNWNNLRKLYSMIFPETYNKLLLVKKLAILQKWWGRHQKNWNPIEKNAKKVNL